MEDFKLEVGMFVRVRYSNIYVVTEDENLVCMSDNEDVCDVERLNGYQYEVSYTYDFKEIIYTNKKKVTLTKEEKEIINKWVDLIGREEIVYIRFYEYGKQMHFEIFTSNDKAKSISYKNMFNSVEDFMEYTLEELGL